jgi:hypothetical protein
MRGYIRKGNAFEVLKQEENINCIPKKRKGHADDILAKPQYEFKT